MNRSWRRRTDRVKLCVAVVGPLPTYAAATDATLWTTQNRPGLNMTRVPGRHAAGRPASCRIRWVERFSRGSRSLLPPPGAACETHRFLGRAKECLSFVDALLLLGLRVRVVDDAGSGLHEHTPVLHDRRAQDDAGIHLPVRAEITDAAGVGTTFVLLQFVDDFHSPHLRRTRDRAGRKAGDQRAERVEARIEPPLDIRDDVHDLTVALKKKAVRYFYGPMGRYPPDVVAAEVEQHEALGPLLGIGEKLLAKTAVLGWRRAAWAGAGDRPDRHRALAHPHQDFGAGADDLERLKIEVAQEWRRIDAPQ